MSRKLPCGRPLPPPPPPPGAKRLGEIRESLKVYLSREGLKFTEQRWRMVQLILETGGHLDAQGIVSKVKKAYPSIGAATVYRNIKVLCEAGILEPTHQNMDGRDVYELPQDDHHDHILCVDCGEVFEFSNDGIHDLQDEVARDFSFQLKGHRHVLHGSCAYLKARRGRLKF
jgi:Fur family ferric uptake transcriptional regulator